MALTDPSALGTEGRLQGANPSAFLRPGFVVYPQNPLSWEVWGEFCSEKPCSLCEGTAGEAALHLPQTERSPALHVQGNKISVCSRPNRQDRREDHALQTLQKGNEAQRDEVTSLRSHGEFVAEPRTELRSPGSSSTSSTVRDSFPFPSSQVKNKTEVRVPLAAT